MTAHEKLQEFLRTNEWKQYDTYPPTWPEILQESWSKKSFGDVQLTLNYTVLNIHGILAPFVSVDIKLTKNGIWYNLQAYSISPKEFMEKYVEIEDTLIALRSTLCL